MLYVDQFVYTNRLRSSTHPLERFFFAFFTMLLGLAVNKPHVHAVIILLMLGLLFFKARIPGFVIFKMLSVPFAFLLVGTGTIALTFGPEDVDMLRLFQIAGYQVGFTTTGLWLAGLIFLKSLSSVTCLYFLSFTTPMTELIYVLKLLRLPRVVIELMVIIYRFVFIFIESAFSIYTAQSARWGYASYRRTMYSLGVLLANIWGKAYLRAQRLFSSLLSRGYTGGLNFIEPPYSYSLRNILAIILLDAALLILAMY